MPGERLTQLVDGTRSVERSGVRGRRVRSPAGTRALEVVASGDVEGRHPWQFPIRDPAGSASQPWR